jgi:hypothetical protein
MVNIDNVLKSIEEQSKSLAEKLFKQYAQQAFTDIRDFLQKSKADLERWIQELARGQIDGDEFKSAVQGQLDVAEMRALKQAGLAQVRIDIFTSGVLDIVASAAFAAIP